MSQGQQRKTGAVVVEVDPTTARRREVPPAVEESPLFGVAMLKIAMELKRHGERDLDEILTGVLTRMNIPEREFRQYLEQNGGLLRTIAQKRRY